jgi:GNAT superfamily N-acetyltransferase
MPKFKAGIVEDLVIRNPTLDDAQRTLDLMIRCDVSEYGEPDADMTDLLFDWNRIDLDRDAWLALTPDGGVVGYGAVLPWVSDIQYDFYVDPSWEGTKLGQDLLEHCNERGLFLAKEYEGVGVMLANTYIAHVNQRNREIVEGAGFHLKKYIFQMRIEMDSAPREPRWSPGISIRTAVPNQDDRTIFELIQSAFDQPGRTPPSFGEWKAFMMRPDIFEADLWFLGVAGEQVVGACLCFEYPGQGWVRQLCVAESWRRKGLGTALLLHAFGEFRKRRISEVGLTVDSHNPRAFNFYQRVGMKRIRQYDEYEKPLNLE